MQPHGPALGAPHELGQLGLGRAHARGRQQHPRVVEVQPQVGGADVEDLTVRTQAGKSQRWFQAAADRHLAAGEEVPDHRPERVGALRVGEHVGVVEHEQEGRWGGGHRGRQRGDDRGAPRGMGGAQVVEHRGWDGDDPLQDDGEVGQQDGGVVEARVEGEPRDRPRILVDPLRQQSRLAVARWRQDRHHARLPGEQEPTEDRRARHRPLGNGGRSGPRRQQREPHRGRARLRPRTRLDGPRVGPAAAHARTIGRRRSRHQPLRSAGTSRRAGCARSHRATTERV